MNDVKGLDRATLFLFTDVTRKHQEANVMFSKLLQKGEALPAIPEGTENAIIKPIWLSLQQSSQISLV